MVRRLLRVVPAAALLSLAACGGGSSTGVSPITPSPVPPPPTYSALPLSQAATFATITSKVSISGPATGSGTVAFEAAGTASSSNAVTVGYDPATQTYTLTDGAISQTFGPADGLTPAGGSYSKSSDYLTIYSNVTAPLPATALVQLTYLSYGFWSHGLNTAGEKRQTWFLFGYPTLASDMPRTGTATYSAKVAGGFMNGIDATGRGGSQLSVMGTATFSADFGAGSVTTGLNLIHSDLGSEFPVGTFSGTGNITSATGQFSGSFTSTDSPFSGTFNGGFFGPQAKEMGYGFFLSGHQANVGMGGMDWKINGVVVGTKN